ncbi:hypothetical protein A2U01_0051818, partial [Trifolium medium]|nr:hypothetical protein [Trifolium medium]
QTLEAEELAAHDDGIAGGSEGSASI